MGKIPCSGSRGYDLEEALSTFLSQDMLLQLHDSAFDAGLGNLSLERVDEVRLHLLPDLCIRREIRVDAVGFTLRMDTRDDILNHNLGT